MVHTSSGRKPVRKPKAKTYTCYVPGRVQPSSRPMFGYTHPGCL